MKTRSGINAAYACVLLFMLACSSNDDPTPANEKYRIKEWRYKSGEVVTFTYETDGKLLKIGSLDGTTTYRYDSKGRLTSTVVDGGSYQYHRTDYTYRVDGTAEESISVFKRTGSAIEEKNRTSYTYTGKFLTESRYFYWDNARGQWITADNYVTKYTYDDKGKLLRSSSTSAYYVSQYDEAGNRIDYRNYELKPGSDTEFYMWRHVTYTYDDKKTVYNDAHYPYPQSYRPGPNNSVDVVQREYDEKGNLTRTSSGTSKYIYNEQGYPTKQNEDELILEAY